jgi:hypothetical protein
VTHVTSIIRIVIEVFRDGIVLVDGDLRERLCLYRAINELGELFLVNRLLLLFF